MIVNRPRPRLRLRLRLRLRPIFSRGFFHQGQCVGLAPTAPSQARRVRSPSRRTALAAQERLLHRFQRWLLARLRWPVLPLRPPASGLAAPAARARATRAALSRASGASAQPRLRRGPAFGMIRRGPTLGCVLSAKRGRAASGRFRCCGPAEGRGGAQGDAHVAAHVVSSGFLLTLLYPAARLLGATPPHG